jgi:hypothetical protein
MFNQFPHRDVVAPTPTHGMSSEPAETHTLQHWSAVCAIVDHIASHRRRRRVGNVIYRMTASSSTAPQRRSAGRANTRFAGMISTSRSWTSSQRRRIQSFIKASSTASPSQSTPPPASAVSALSASVSRSRSFPCEPNGLHDPAQPAVCRGRTASAPDVGTMPK